MAVENRTAMFYKTFVLVEVTVTVTDMNRSYCYGTMPEMELLYIVLVSFMYLENMLSDINWSPTKANSPYIVSVPVFDVSTDGKVYNLSTVQLVAL